MKYSFPLAVPMSIILLTAVSVIAQVDNTSENQDNGSPDVARDGQTQAQLRSKLRQAKSDRNTARSRADADPQQIKELTRQVKQLRQSLKDPQSERSVAATETERRSNKGSAGPRGPGAGGPGWGGGSGRGQCPAGCGIGPGRGADWGPGGRSRQTAPLSQKTTHAADHDVIHFLVENRHKIQRTITMLPDGISTLTESEDPDIAAEIRKHVESMARRIQEGMPIRMRDPLFAEIFRNAEKINVTREQTKNGMRVKETSADPRVVRLLQAHAEVVSLFLKNGYSELRKNHSTPDERGDELTAADRAASVPGRRGYGRGPRAGRGFGRGQGLGPGRGNGPGYGRDR